MRIVLLAALVSASGSPLVAQDATFDRFRAGVAFGTAIPNGYAVNVPGDFGVHVQLSGAFARSSRFAVRGDLLALMLSGAAAIPSCVPGAACRGYALHPDQVYSASISAEVRPFNGAPRVFALVGLGAYNARGPEATNFGTTAGASAGAGLDLARPGRAGFSIEARYHYLPNEFGTLTGMLTPSIAFRF